MQPHEHLRRLCALSRLIVDEIPGEAGPGSARLSERSSLPPASTSDGLASRDLHDRINAEAQVMVGTLGLLVDGVADCFQAAPGRGSAVNLQAASTLTRGVLEAAGQIAWLLERDIDGPERIRRYAIWLLSDLRQRRDLLRDSPPAHKDTVAGFELVASEEAAALAQFTAMGWSARPTSADGRKAAVLLTAGGKPDGRPSISAMVALVAPSSGAYSLLSVAAHSYRLGILRGVQRRDSGSGVPNVELSGFGLPPALTLGLTATALTETSLLLATWAGVDSQGIAPELVKFALEIGFTRSE